MRRILSAGSLEEATRLLRDHPDCRVVGGGTVLVPQLERDGWHAPLLDVTRWPETTRLTDCYLGASVSLDAVGGAGHLLPPHLVSAATQVGSPAVRREATVGGNCSPEVAGCVYLTLLSMRAEVTTVTARGRVRRPLLGWAGNSARQPLLTGISWEPATVLAGGFARSTQHAGGGPPRCAVAVTAFATKPALRVVIGYVGDRPLIVDVERVDSPTVMAVVDEVSDLVPATAVRGCLTAAFDTMAVAS